MSPIALRLHKIHYTGLVRFMIEYRLELNTIPLNEMSMTELVLADFFDKWLDKYVNGDRVKWMLRPANKSFKYPINPVVAVALFDCMQHRAYDDNVQCFLVVLTQELINLNYVWYVTPRRSAQSTHLLSTKP